MAKRGRPTVRVTVSPSERTTLEQWARRRTTAQDLAPARADRPGMYGGPLQFGDCIRVADYPADGRAVTSALCRETTGRIGRRAAPGLAALDHRHAGGSGDYRDAGEDAAGRRGRWRRARPQSHHDRAHLAGLRPATASKRPSNSRATRSLLTRSATLSGPISRRRIAPWY